MKRTDLISTLCLAAALAAPGFVLSPAPSYAQAIESEPLEPIPLTPAPSAASQAPSAPTNGTSPYSSTILTSPSPTTPTGASAAYPGAKGADDGMSGMDGGATSVYDLKKSGNMPTQTPADSGAQDTYTYPAPVDGRQTEPYKPADLPAWPSPDKSTRPDDRDLADKKFCTLNVSFGSLAYGPDKRAGDKITAYLDKNADIVTYSKIPWGKEGEYRYCLDIEEHNNRSKIYAGIKRLLPPKGSNVPKTNLYGEGFQPVTNSDQE